MWCGSRGFSFTALLLAACHSGGQTAPSAASATASRPAIAQRCTELLGPRPAGTVPPRVFIEVAQLVGDVGVATGGAPPSAGLTPFDDSRLEVQRVAQVIATNDVASVVAWDTPEATTAVPDEPRRWDLRTTPHLEAGGSAALRLELDLAPAPPLGTPPEAWSVPEHRRVHTTVVLSEQQPVVLALPRGAGAAEPSLMVVTPYFIREDADLRRLFECKMRARPKARG